MGGTKAFDERVPQVDPAEIQAALLKPFIWASNPVPASSFKEQLPRDTSVDVVTGDCL